MYLYRVHIHQTYNTLEGRGKLKRHKMSTLSELLVIYVIDIHWMIDVKFKI